MNTLEFLSKYLSSPVVTHRSKALLCMFNEAMVNPQVVNQLGLNLQSNNFDVVLGSLRLLNALCLRDPVKVTFLNNKIINLGRRTNHFGIATLCQDILSNLGHSHDFIFKNLIPKLNVSKDSDRMTLDNWDHFIEYELGGKDYKYEFSDICRAFRYDFKKATKQIFRYMKALGYKKGAHYWKEKPSRWSYDFGGNCYETKHQYYARHAIQIFLMWCIKNLSITADAWEELLTYERKWDASIPDLLFKEKPNFIRFTDMQMDVNIWLKKKIKKADVYKLFDPKFEWIPLYEKTSFQSEDKSFNRNATTCFIRIPISKLSRKMEWVPPYYSCKKCYINELPIEAKKKRRLILDNDCDYEFLKGRLTPSFGIVSENFDEYVKLFPAPEIIEYFKLTQKKNSLEYYRGKELVIQCINWRNGYHRDVGAQGEDRFQLANYGYLLMIKTKYIKKYLKENNLRLLAVGNIWKRKINRYDQTYDFNNKNTKRKQASFEIIKIQ